MNPVLARVSWAVAVAAVVLGAVSCLWDIDEMHAAEEQRQALVSRYRELIRTAVNLDLHRQQRLEIDKTFGVLYEMLPWDFRLGEDRMAAEADEVVRAAAKRSRLHSVSVALAKLERRDTISTRRIDVAVAGDYRDLLGFLQEVSIASGRLWTVEYAALSRRPDGRGLSLLAELTAHAMTDKPEAGRSRSPAR